MNNTNKIGCITAFCIVFIVLISFVGVCVGSCGADTRTVVKKVACDSKCIEAYEKIVTSYEYKWDWLHTEFRLVPNIHTEKHEAEYKLKYRTIYDDLTCKDEWISVSKAEYDEYEELKNSGG